MPEAKFKLRKANDKSATIQLHFSYGTKKRFRYSTGHRIQNIKNWDTGKMRIKHVVEELDWNHINKDLDKLEDHIEDFYFGLLLDEREKVNNDILTELCDIFFEKKKANEEQQKLDLLPFFKWFIENYKANPLMTTGKPLKAGTAKTYNNAYNLLKLFNDEVYRVNYDTINNNFYQQFLNWFYKNNYSTNYIGTQIKILKTILNAGLELGQHTSQEHKRKYFKKPSEEVNNIFLNQEELNKIFNLDLTNVAPIKVPTNSLILTAKKLDLARDLFLISANTSLRVSDFNRLKPSNIIEIDDKQYIKIITEKMQKPVTIPINSMVKSILDKRDGNPPERMPEQHINYALKEIGRLAKINSKETITRTMGGEKKSETKFKYELITNHTGRRSFCTNAYYSKMPTIDIMAISGHSNEKVFYNYIKVNDLQKAIKIGEHKFFN
ncbi:tyrosine-type recombinase/integrase [Gaetbulibacter aquiaggeris]|uniref:Tyrosine-type recombinase/integrase n=1 Tax=Gaetbulibacter aquiaggeris TaxID=1735373 RepID=A0ABW7MLN2_9FLAO